MLNPSEIAALKKGIEEERQRAEEVYRKKLEAIALLFGSDSANGASDHSIIHQPPADDTDQPPVEPPTDDGGPEPPQDLRPLSEKGALTAAVRDAIVHVGPRFTVLDIAEHLESVGYDSEDIKKPSVNAVLKNFLESDVIALISTGSGRRPSVYRRPPSLHD